MTLGLLLDETSNEMMELDDLGAALAAEDVEQLDFIVFDMCLMGQLETAYEVRAAADYLIFTQELMSMEGIPWEFILPDLKSNPDISPEDLIQNIVTQFIQAYDEGGPYHHPGFGFPFISAVNTSVLESVAVALDEFAQALLSESVLPTNFDTLCRVREHTQGFRGYAHLMDLADFAHNAALFLDDSTLQVLAGQLQNRTLDSIFVEDNLWLVPNATGMSICMNSYHSYQYSLADNTHWDELMDEFVTIGSTSQSSRSIDAPGIYYGYLDGNNDVFNFKLQPLEDCNCTFILEDVKADFVFGKDFDLKLYNHQLHILLACSNQNSDYESIDYVLEAGKTYYLQGQAVYVPGSSFPSSGVFRLTAEMSPIETSSPSFSTSTFSSISSTGFDFLVVISMLAFIGLIITKHKRKRQH